MQSADRARAHAIAAAIVIHKPDPEVLATLLGTIAGEGRRLFLFLNGPAGPEVAPLLQGVPNARGLETPRNVGLGAGLNRVMEAGAEEGYRDVVLFDQDSTPGPGFFDALAARRDARAGGARVAVTGPLLVPAEGHPPIRYTWRNMAEGTVDFVPTSGSLVPVAAWRSVGPFREDYFIGAIDVEWCFRAWARGWCCVVARDVTMLHRYGSAEPAGGAWKPQILRYSDARIYFHLRNSLNLLRLSHPPLRWKLSAAPRLAAQAALLLASRTFAPSVLRCLWLALRDGWSGRLGPLPDRLATRQQTSA